MVSPVLLQQGTDKRRQMYAFIKEFIKLHGFGPSIDEIALQMNFGSRSTVRYHLTKMLDQGVISQTPGKYRSLMVPDGRRMPS